MGKIDVDSTVNDGGVLGDIVRCLPTPESLLLLHLKLAMQSYQSSSVFSFGQMRIAPAKERIMARTKAIFHGIIAFKNASEINKAITNA